MSTTSVDLIGRYSNPPRTLVDLGKLVEGGWDAGPDETFERPPRQHQRRLRADELEQLKDDYIVGVPMIELAERYGVARQTVIERMLRLAVPRRHPRLGPDEVARACYLYRAGQSLATVGAALAPTPAPFVESSARLPFPFVTPTVGRGRGR
jgi:hypothetical protein